MRNIRHLAAELQKVAAQVTPKESQEDAGRAIPGRSFADQLEENRTWNVLSIEFFLYALRHPWAQQQLAERYRLARQDLSDRLREKYQAEGGLPAFPIEYLAWALLALGHGLALQAYLEPGALPTDLYATIVKRLLDAPRP